MFSIYQSSGLKADLNNSLAIEVYVQVLNRLSPSSGDLLPILSSVLRRFLMLDWIFLSPSIFRKRMLLKNLTGEIQDTSGEK